METLGYLRNGISHPSQTAEGDFGTAQEWIFLGDTTDKMIGCDVHPM